MKKTDSNPILDFALDYKFPEYETESGLERVVAFGDQSHKCPTYVRKVPPCTGGCPAGEDIRGYHNILRGIEKVEGYDDKWEAAFHRITAVNPFPSIMGRVCPAPCESSCNRKDLDETIGINAVEHSIGDYAIKNNFKLKPSNVPKTGKKVAVVGSGPAGLSCAYQLKLMGHDVMIYESHSKLGGMMQWTILEYRVPRDVLHAEIQRILDLGIDHKTNVTIGKDLSLEELRAEYDAVFLGIGAQNGRLLPVPGGDSANGYTNAINFLKSFELDRNSVEAGDNVIVVGDGDVAMDVLRLALRLGSKKVSLLSGVPREAMSCSPFEFDEAQSEGAEFIYSTGTKEIVVENGKVVGVAVVDMVQKEKGEEGWNSKIPFFRYKEKAGTNRILKTDMLISSIGQALDLRGLETVKNGNSGPWFSVNKYYQVSGHEDIFTGGDTLSLTLLTTAIGHGRHAAMAIDSYISGKPMPTTTRDDIIPYEEISSYYFEKRPQVKRNHQNIENVINNYNELLKPLSEQETISESDRCMSCGLCFECNQCMLYCPQEAIVKFKKNPMGEVMYTNYEKCVGCHICAEVCPCGYIHMGMGEDL